jgi:hypothetical protein
MMGIAEIRDINRRMTNKARRNKTLPFVPTEAQRAEFANGNLQAPGARIPFLADYVPKGWVKDEDEFFVDMSGFGRDDEPALSQRQFALRLALLPPGYGIAMTEQGQFQGYVGVYHPKEKSNARTR